MDFKIRSIEEADFSQIVELFREFAEFEKSPDDMENSLERMTLEKDFFNGWVAENDDGTIIGYTSYFFAYYTWVGKCLHLDDLYVKSAHRGNGLGTILIHKVIDFAKQSGCHSLVWQVSSGNKPAIKFYKNLGAEFSNPEFSCELKIQ